MRQADLRRNNLASIFRPGRSEGGFVHLDWSRRAVTNRDRMLSGSDWGHRGRYERGLTSDWLRWGGATMDDNDDEIEHQTADLVWMGSILLSRHKRCYQYQ